MRNKNTGSTLLVSLMVLLMLTVMGMSSIEGVTLNQKVASNYQDHDMIFQAAEAVLMEGEQAAKALSINFNEDNFAADCIGDECFTSTCNQGKCFNGSYSAGTICTLDEPDLAIALDEATWNTEGRAQVSNLAFSNLSVQPRYIIEFICYLSNGISAPVAPPPYTAADWSFLYRVSSYAVGTTGDSYVILQSTYSALQ